jgi:flagellum-specific peptidoglycan hydrolase FlgJ
MTHVKPEHSGVQARIRAQAPSAAGELPEPSPMTYVQSTLLSVRRGSAGRAIGAGLAAGVILLAAVFPSGSATQPVDITAAAEAMAVTVDLTPSIERAGTQYSIGTVPVPGATEETPPVATPVPAPVVVDLPEWVRNVEPVAVWSHAQDPAKELAELSEGSRLRVISQRDDSRALVHHTEPAPKGEVVIGWVDRTQLEPADGTSRVTASSRGGDRAAPETEKPDQFIASVLEAAQESERQYRVPTSVIIAQAIIESGWGRSGLAKNAHNYFGIKANKPGPAGVVNMNTMEVVRGAGVMVNAGFKAYHNAYESFLDHGLFLSENPRYSEAFKTTDPKEFVRRVHSAGYASDPAYTTKLISTMDFYDLYRFNVAHESGGR